MRKNVRKTGAMAGLIVVMFFYYQFEWGSFENYVNRVDHTKLFLADFIMHYYPVSNKIFEFDKLIGGYYYTSFFALLIAPICLFSLPVAIKLWTVFQFGNLATFYFSSCKLFKLSFKYAWIYLAVLISSYPILHNIKWGQVSIFLISLVILSIFASKRGWDILAGVALAIAVTIKYYPIIFIMYFVFKKKYWTCLICLFSMLLLYCVFPSLTIGWSTWLSFEKASLAALSGAQGFSTDINSQYSVSVISRLTSSWIDAATIFGPLKIFSYIVAVSCFLLAWIFLQNSETDNFQLAAISIFLAIPFLIGTSWPHYFCYLPFCQIGLLHYLIYKYQSAKILNSIMIFAIAVSILISSIFIFNRFENWIAYNKHGMLFLANLLLLGSLYLIILNRKYFDIDLKSKKVKSKVIAASN